MSAESWAGMLMLGLVAVMVIVAVWYAFSAEAPGRAEGGDQGKDTMTALERGIHLGWQAASDEAAKREELLEKETMRLAGALRITTEMGVRVPIELSGGRWDGVKATATPGAPSVIVEEGDGTRHEYVWVSRSAGGGKRWVYEFRGVETLNSKL